jgi:hypothetical protein
MSSIYRSITGIILLISGSGFSQDYIPAEQIRKDENRKEFFGFIRGGFYTGIDHDDNNKLYIPSAYSDFALKSEFSNSLNWKAFADVRFRYGVEFEEPVNYFDIREAYVKVNGKQWDLSAGQMIIKWGRADFTNPTSKLSPQNLILRSPDREDINMGNLVSSVNWYTAGFLNLEAVVIPYYRSSVLIIDPVPLPENVSINQINSLITGKEMFSYGFKTDFHLRGIDWSLSWFDGNDPMPGIALSNFSFDLSAPIPVPLIEMETIPYKTKILGLDFETSFGSFGIRGESAWSVPDLSFELYEYVPWPEIKWVAGLDWSKGIWRITGEYSGKYIIDFTPATVDPIIGTEPDNVQMAQMAAIPGFDPEAYFRQQLQAFNRLYNYQLEKYYHSAGLRVESDFAYGKLLPSLFSMYNFTSRDLLIIPEFKFKPSDGLAITAGAEFYSGCKGSLYDIVDGFMNSIYVSLRVDF